MSFNEIYEGWRNAISPPERLKELITAVSLYRIEICENCHYHSKNHITIRPDAHCTNCGCTLMAKTACLSCSCPDSPPRWVSVIPRDMEDEMKASLKTEQNGK